MRYRVNYGNGQVSSSFATKREALRHIEEAKSYGDPYVGLFFIQRRDADGFWMSTATAKQ